MLTCANLPTRSAPRLQPHPQLIPNTSGRCRLWDTWTFDRQSAPPSNSVSTVTAAAHAEHYMTCSVHLVAGVRKLPALEAGIWAPDATTRTSGRPSGASPRRLCWRSLGASPSLYRGACLGRNTGQMGKAIVSSLLIRWLSGASPRLSLLRASGASPSTLREASLG